MFVKTVIFLCFVAVFIEINARPLNRDGQKNLKSQNKVFKLQLSHNDINRGVSIELSRRPARSIIYMPKIRNPVAPNVKQLRKERRLQRKRLTKMQVKALADMENERKNTLELGKSIEKTAIMRSKRNVPLSEIGETKKLQIENLQQFSEDDGDHEAADEYHDENEDEDVKKISEKIEAKKSSQKKIEKKSNDEVTSTKTNVQAKTTEKSNSRRTQLNNKPNQFHKSKDNHYVVDATNIEIINEVDDLLENFYSRYPRHSTNDNVVDTIRKSAAENNFVKLLHYGRYNELLNDEAAVITNDKNNKNVNNKVYDVYDDYDDDF